MNPGAGDLVLPRPQRLLVVPALLEGSDDGVFRGAGHMHHATLTERISAGDSRGRASLGRLRKLEAQSVQNLLRRVAALGLPFLQRGAERRNMLTVAAY